MIGSREHRSPLPNGGGACAVEWPHVRHGRLQGRRCAYASLRVGAWPFNTTTAKAIRGPTSHASRLALGPLTTSPPMLHTPYVRQPGGQPRCSMGPVAHR